MNEYPMVNDGRRFGKGRKLMPHTSDTNVIKMPYISSD